MGDVAEGCAACGGRAIEAYYSTTQAVERELGDVAWAIYDVGDEVQRGLIDVAFDVASFSVRDVLTRTAELTGQVQESASVLGTTTGLELAWQQTRNNIEVYNLVKNVRAELRIDEHGEVDLAALVTAAYDLGPYADLWAIEGLGHDYTNIRLDRDGAVKGILRDGPAATLPASTLTMMHAGLGLALAERMLPPLTPCSPAREFREVLAAYISACDAHGRPGYVGAAYESLGLVARTWHSLLMTGIDAALLEMDEGIDAYFWHGAGRALYFLPTYIVPVLSPWRAADREAPHELAHRNLYAGLAWASTLVNIRQPRVLAGLLRTRGDELQRSNAFANGVASALVVAMDITPDDPFVIAFARYVPDESSGAARAWHAVVAPAAQAALNWYHPVLRSHNALDVVFRYADLTDLTTWLLRGDAPLSPPSMRHAGSAALRCPAIQPSALV